MTIKSWLRSLLVSGLLISPIVSEAATVGTATVTWNNAGDTFDAVFIERAPAAAGPFSALAGLPANTTSYIDSGLAVPSTVCYRLYLKTAQGIVGPFSVVDAVNSCKTFTAPTVPPAPLNLKVTGTITIDGTITVTVP